MPSSSCQYTVIHHVIHRRVIHGVRETCGETHEGQTVFIRLLLQGVDEEQAPFDRNTEPF